MYKHIPHSLACCISEGREGEVVHVMTHRMNAADCCVNTDPDQFHYIQGGADTHYSPLHVLYSHTYIHTRQKMLLTSVPP